MRAFIAWLYRRFPPRLTVTTQDWTELRQEVAQLNLIAQGIQELNSRLLVLEKDIRQLNDAQGFVTHGKGSIRLER